MTLPRLTFFCELEQEQFVDLLDDNLIADLARINACLSIGILDLSEERAGVVQRLNRAGIPLTAWLLLPEEQGYWFNLYNARQAIARYEAFKEWTSVHDLHWEGVGLDIEPDIREMSQLASRDWRVLPEILRRMVDFRLQQDAIQAYLRLVTRIRADGYQVDSYQFPIIADERQVGSAFLQRLAGLIDLPVDREVWMIYSSFLRPNGAGVIASYGPESQSIAVGSTGGGVDLDIEALQTSPLTWDELARDLRLAWGWCDDLHIFSLEGCVRQGFLQRLEEFTWDRATILPDSSRAKVDGWRNALRTSLWVTSHFSQIVLVITGAFIVWKGIKRLLSRR